MPKYYRFKIAGYYLYFTSHCTLECMHAHASDNGLTEEIAAKFFIKNNGDTVVQRKGILKNREILEIQTFIKEHYNEMYKLWAEYSDNGFYRGE